MNTEIIENGTNVVLVDGRKLTVESYAKGWYAATDGSKFRGNKVVEISMKAKAKKAAPTGDIDPLIEDEIEKDEKKKNRNMAETLKKYSNAYANGVSSTGRVSMNNGDTLASMLSGLDPDAIMSLAEAVCELPSGELHARYAKLNRGQRRMNAGNRIRGRISNGELTLDELKKLIPED